MPDFSEVPLLIAFIDLTRFVAQAERLEDAEVARIMDGYYELVGRTVQAAGGRAVKFIGDAALIVFPSEAVDRGVLALLDLKRAVDQSMAERAWECRLIAKIHFGSVVAGHFGAQGDKRYDVLGKAVNVTAKLNTSGVALSAEAFQHLSPEVRKRFQKHTPPVTYIQQEDSHPPPHASRR